LRLTLSYAGFLVFAGLVVLAGVYLVLRYGPNYSFTRAVPQYEGAVAEDTEAALLRVSVGILISLAIIGLAGGWILAGHMLRPLQAITAAARFAAATGSLNHRIELPGRRDEFTELSDTFDAMLDRLQQSFEEQRRFAANASHELRTPLAIINTILEVAIAEPDRKDTEEVFRRLYETNQRGINIVETLLTLSALSRGQVESHRIDLAAIVEDALDSLSFEADAAAVCMEERLATCEVVGNEVLLHQLVVNLGQNGIRHNLACGGRLRVSVSPDAGDASRCLLVFENTGPMLTPALVQTLTEPFVRGQGRVASSQGRRVGHGLGLTLAAKIVEVHGGLLRLRPNPSGGLTATISLPRAGTN
jgi:two-component system sensor histidine kinase VanS